MLAKKTKKERRDPREEAFLYAFFNEGPPQGNIKASALAAGYAEDKAEAVGQRILTAYDKKPFTKALEAAGLTKAYMALKLKRFIDEGHVREFVPALRIALKAGGELEEGSGAANINVQGQGAQVLVVVGKTDDKMKRLKAGQPILPPAGG